VTVESGDVARASGRLLGADVTETFGRERERRRDVRNRQT
jgi:hypothetical protein